MIQWLNRVAFGFVVTFSVIMMFSGCTTLTTQIDRVRTVPEAEPEADQQPVQTAILLSDNIPVFASIAKELQQRVGGGHYTIHNLHGRPGDGRRVKAEIARSDAKQLVAIGLLAAKVAREIEGQRMVFCQVFNYQDHDLISATSKGVSFLPPFDLQVEAWRELSPELRNVGVIAGPNQEGLIAEIRRAAEKQKIELLSRTVNSDKEALLAFRRLTPNIQGLWLLPDNRILSPQVIREIMSYSAKHRTQLVVFGDALLGMGALISITSNDADVADQVLTRLSRVARNGNLAGPEMVPLTQMQTKINLEVARHLGLTVPERFAQTGPGE
jgi:ABC-type uncharacterized transport system substrate-binding protein